MTRRRVAIVAVLCAVAFGAAWAVASASGEDSPRRGGPGPASLSAPPPADPPEISAGRALPPLRAQRRRPSPEPSTPSPAPASAPAPAPAPTPAPAPAPARAPEPAPAPAPAPQPAPQPPPDQGESFFNDG